VVRGLDELQRRVAEAREVVTCACNYATRPEQIEEATKRYGEALREYRAALETMTSRPGAARSGEEIVPLQRMARVLSERDERSDLLAKAIAGLTPLQRDLYGTRQRSLLDIPPKPETEAWYARRADERRERKAAKKAENQRRAEAGKHPNDSNSATE
jgi:hypothetical protein